MFGLQPLHIIVIVGIALIIFGPSRLPELGKAIGNSIREFRDAASTTQDAIRQGVEGKSAESESKSDTTPKS